MKRYIRSGKYMKNYEYNEFLDRKNRNNLLEAIANTAAKYGLEADYLSEMDFHDPNGLGDNNETWGNSISILSNGAEIADYTVQGFDSYIQIWGDKPKKFKSFDDALQYMNRELRSLSGGTTITSSQAIEAKVSENDYSESLKGTAYKVFRIKNGKLYPPMVANPGGEDTPVGVWLDAEEGEFAGLSKTGRPQVKQAKGGQTLAYRPGWHLGDVPRAKQFDRSFSWEIVEDVSPNQNAELIDATVKTYNTFINSYAKASNVGKVFYIEDLGECLQVVDDNAPYFPYDFVWAECEYVMDVDYQAEADEQGYMRTNPDGTTYRSDKYQHSLAGLPKLPKNGYYKYRTNPNPDTVPWVITGAIKVNKLLDDFDVQAILGGSAPQRQGGDKTLEQLGLSQI